MLEDPGVAVTVPPVHVLTTLAVPATSMPAGKLSVKAKALSSSVLAVLSMVKVSVLGVLTGTPAGAKALAKAGATAFTSKVFCTKLVVNVVGPNGPEVAIVVVRILPVTRV